MIRRPPRPPLFPYTPLFRSRRSSGWPRGRRPRRRGGARPVPAPHRAARPAPPLPESSRAPVVFGGREPGGRGHGREPRLRPGGGAAGPGGTRAPRLSHRRPFSLPLQLDGRRPVPKIQGRRPGRLRFAGLGRRLRGRSALKRRAHALGEIEVGPQGTAALAERAAEQEGDFAPVDDAGTVGVVDLLAEEVTELVDQYVRATRRGAYAGQDLFRHLVVPRVVLFELLVQKDEVDDGVEVFVGVRSLPFDRLPVLAVVLVERRLEEVVAAGVDELGSEETQSLLQDPVVEQVVLRHLARRGVVDLTLEGQVHEVGRLLTGMDHVELADENDVDARHVARSML